MRCCPPQSGGRWSASACARVSVAAGPVPVMRWPTAGWTWRGCGCCFRQLCHGWLQANGRCGPWMARTGRDRRRPPVRRIPGSTVPCPANRNRGWSPPGPTTGWCKCRSQRAAGCCRWTCSRVAPPPRPRRRWPFARSSRHAPAKRPRRPDRWWHWTALTRWANLPKPTWRRTWWCAWPRTASSAAPQPYSGRGRPHTHGPVFKLQDASTHGPADRSASLEHPVYGTVTVEAWTGLHTQEAAAAPFTVVRVQVEHLPHLDQPMPLWLAWIGGELPEDLHQVWRWYLRRFCVEHAFRFAKQQLGWTTVRPRSPIAADRWTWLVAAVFWQLWLARPVVAEHRLPWERPRPAERLTPGRVQRAFGGLLVTLGTPARVPQPRGKSPGRHPGQRPEPAPRLPVAP